MKEKVTNEPYQTKADDGTKTVLPRSKSENQRRHCRAKSDEPWGKHGQTARTKEDRNVAARRCSVVKSSLASEH